MARPDHISFQNRRRPTVTVNIGGVPLGSDFPIRIQSMANTLTGNIEASVAQCIRVINAGADYVRFTVPSLSDADAFAAIKNEIRNKGYGTPLIADVHFNPDIALKVAEFADKVRINPGNFSNRDRFISLVEKCRPRRVAIRIGVNHGSLSERIMEKYGDTPAGMAESAMEYLRICRELKFDQVVVSMKASNVRVMIYATRLIADMMDKEGMHFPLHLGVTEAGEGEDGRIKSAVGIGTLLTEGLGDTIRVSLTEEPEDEIPVARKLVEIRDEGQGTRDKEEGERGRYEYVKRKSRATGNIGGNNPPMVVGYDNIDPETVLVYKAGQTNVPAKLKWFRHDLEQKQSDVPVIFKLDLEEQSPEDFMIRAAASLGGTFIDGFGDGIWLNNKYPFDKESMNSVALGILQACRARMSKTEYISCPSCGRTHFNLMETLARIKAATSHLKGLKIGVMGCIVNGPGEMADADYGYVGAGKGKITLYKAKEVVKRGIPEEKAVSELIDLIKSNGDWKDPD